MSLFSLTCSYIRIHEADFIHFSRKKKLARSFNLTFGCIDDVLSLISESVTNKISNHFFGVNLPIHLHLKGTSLQKGIFPSTWKIARVMPAFKKDDKSCIGKVMERAVYKYTYNFIFEHSLLYAYQSGFIRGHSTLCQFSNIYIR
jgi:hypothetical protein